MCWPSFQSTLPYGSDNYCKKYHLPGVTFQSTLPLGSDCAALIAANFSANFNSRSLAGATGSAPSAMPRTAFQSTLPLGSDRAFCSCLRLEPVFQSTLPRGSDLHCVAYGPHFDISIHAPSRERQWARAASDTPARNFNPRSLAGATALR